MKAGLRPSSSAKQWIPFKQYGLFKLDRWEEPRPHKITVFYLLRDGAEYKLGFPTSYYYANVVGFNVDRLIEELLDLGFRLEGKNQEPRLDLRMYNDQAFFDALFDLVMQTLSELEGTLQG